MGGQARTWLFNTHLCIMYSGSHVYFASWPPNTPAFQHCPWSSLFIAHYLCPGPITVEVSLGQECQQASCDMTILTIKLWSLRLRICEVYCARVPLLNCVWLAASTKERRCISARDWKGTRFIFSLGGYSVAQSVWPHHQVIKRRSEGPRAVSEFPRAYMEHH